MSKPNIDLGIFKVVNNKWSSCKSGIDADSNELCIQLKRLISSNNYYRTLDVHNDVNHKEVFRQFIMETYYDDVINDYEHLMLCHKNDLYRINQIILKPQRSSNKSKLYII